MIYNFGILGYGYVGKGTHLGILDNRPAAIHDTLLGTNRSVLKDSKIVFHKLKNGQTLYSAELTKQH